MFSPLPLYPVRFKAVICKIYTCYKSTEWMNMKKGGKLKEHWCHEAHRFAELMFLIGAFGRPLSTNEEEEVTLPWQQWWESDRPVRLPSWSDHDQSVLIWLLVDIYHDKYLEPWQESPLMLQPIKQPGTGWHHITSGQPSGPAGNSCFLHLCITDKCCRSRG